MNVKVTLVNLLLAGSFAATPVAFATTKAVDLQDLKFGRRKLCPHHRCRRWISGAGTPPTGRIPSPSIPPPSGVSLHDQSE